MKESLDIDALGADIINSSIAPSPFSSPATQPAATQPAATATSTVPPPTPTTVPPAPTPALPSSSSSSAATDRPAMRPSLSSSPGSDVFYDAEEPHDFTHTKRRSMYRSPGTASSPDLATLVRKQKERAAAAAAAASKDGQKSIPTSLYDPSNNDGARPRHRPSTSSSRPHSPPQTTPAPKGKSKVRQVLGVDTTPNAAPAPDWVWASPKSAQSFKEGGKPAKSSVRQKTSAFLGKMLGSSSTRDRSRSLTTSPSSTSIATYPTSPSLLDAFTPPVPPIPDKHKAIPPPADAPDVLSNSRASELKRLPSLPADSQPSEAESDETHTFGRLADLPTRSRSPSPNTTVRQRGGRHASSASRSKRRSMSVSDVDVQKLMASLPRQSGENKRASGGLGLDTTLNGILSEFQGQLSSLDSMSTGSLDLCDPSTSAQRPGPGTRSHSANDALTISQARPHVKSAASLPPPTVRLHAAAGPEEHAPTVRSPPSSSRSLPADEPLVLRPSSTNTPIRSRSGSSTHMRAAPLKYGPRAPHRNAASPLTHHHSTSRDANRLRVQHRSSASTSEPSLVPAREDARAGEPHNAIRLVPSANSLAPRSAFGAASQQDLTSSHAFKRSSRLAEDSSDINVRGKDLAKRCWEEDEEFLAKDKIAEWLGGQSLINRTALRHYVEFFDFTGLRLDLAFRRFCAKLYLKGETQQVDRILAEFARRYWDCNPTSIFGSASVVHAVTYSLLLLNTDLHVAELVTRMSRGQFVRNTIAAIQMQVQPDGSTSDLPSTYDDWSSLRGASDGSEVDGSTIRSRAKRSDSIASWNSVHRDSIFSVVPHGGSSGQLTAPSEMGDPSTSGNASSVSVASGPDARDGKAQDAKAEAKAAWRKSSDPLSAAPEKQVVYDRAWEVEMETLLKDMYTAVKSNQILQPIGSALMARSSTGSLSPHGAVLRSRSLRTAPQDRITNLKRGSIRGLQSILGAQTGGSPYGSNSSADGRASPAPSFATSHEGLASTASFLTPALGFASNLSHTIIREDKEDDSLSVHSERSGMTDISITDEELALLGPPWAKEGMLCRKQYWESAGKRAKSKAWLDVFVVIQKGELSMFTFGDHHNSGSGVVGGGNWLENADSAGTVLLAHSLAHALPPPGYNRQRPHCMVLTLANGGVYFFQAGTEELVNEWVSTCNYWAARLSKEPLAGGVSNMEYGWNRVMDPVTRVRSASEDALSTRDPDTDGMSVRSGRSGRSRFKELAATVRAEKSPWKDQTVINEWKPPMPPTVASTHDEEAQMEALQKHVASLKDDLKIHNELRTPMMHLYQPRSSNASKALSNWEKKSQYLLTEIVKYESYIDSLQAAMTLRLKKRGEKALERALVVSSPTEDEAMDSAKAKWRGQPEEYTIAEDEEPPASAGINPSPVHRHRRELAELGDSDGRDD